MLTRAKFRHNNIFNPPAKHGSYLRISKLNLYLKILTIFAHDFQKIENSLGKFISPQKLDEKKEKKVHCRAAGMKMQQVFITYLYVNALSQPGASL